MERRFYSRPESKGSSESGESGGINGLIEAAAGFYLENELTALSRQMPLQRAVVADIIKRAGGTGRAANDERGQSRK